MKQKRTILSAIVLGLTLANAGAARAAISNDGLPPSSVQSPCETSVLSSHRGRIVDRPTCSGSEAQPRIWLMNPARRYRRAEVVAPLPIEPGLPAPLPQEQTRPPSTSRSLSR